MSAPRDWIDRDRPHLWTVAVLVASAPFLMILCGTLWRTPFPIREAVALFEDIARQPPSHLLIPDNAYYRPLFHLTLSALWHNAGSLEATLAWIKLLHIVPVILLVVLFIWHLRPRTALDAAAAAVAVAVLVGSRGFRDNLEIPLSYTIVGMPIALLVWMLLNREPRISHPVSHPNAQARGPHGARLRRGVEMCALGTPVWQGAVIVALTLIAIGFKEQGLVIIPLVVGAWWTRVPGANRGIVAAVAAVALAYVGLRLSGHGSWSLFEQAVGFGFSEMEPPEAAARFGAFPFWIYAYSGASTMANVLFSEPTRGVFRIVQHLSEGHPEIWELIHLVSSVGLTTVIAWWGIRSLRSPRESRWSPESRVFIAMLVVLLGSGVLSFNYSRDRLGGMAVVFYAVASFFAVRAAAARTLEAPRSRFVVASLAIGLLAAAWHTRAVTTIEIARIFASRNEMEWIVMLPERRMEFAERPVYLHIMQTMIDQGTESAAPRPTRYPRWVKRTLGLP